MYFKERWELHKNAACCLERIQKHLTKQLLYCHLTPISQNIQDAQGMLGTAGEKQGWTHKRGSPMNPNTLTLQFCSTSKVLYRHWTQSWRLTKRDQLWRHRERERERFKEHYAIINITWWWWYIYIFANGPVDLDSIPGWVIPKTQKNGFLMLPCLTLSIIR